MYDPIGILVTVPIPELIGVILKLVSITLFVIAATRVND